MRLFSIIAIVLAVLVVASTASPAFVFSEFMEGEWDVIFTKPSTNFDALDYDVDVVRKIFISKDNTTSSLVGQLFFNNTVSNEISDLQQLRIDFNEQKNNTGIFLQGTDNDKLGEDFSFEFNMINNIAFSSGKYQKDKEYQFIVPSADRFVFNIYNKEKQLEETLVGRKIPANVPKTFFQQYGMYIMMAVLMIFNMYVQNKAKSFQDQQVATAAGDAGSADADIARAKELLAAQGQKNNKKKSKKDD